MWSGVSNVICFAPALTAVTCSNWDIERSCRLNQRRVPSEGLPPGGPNTGPHTTSGSLSVLISTRTMSPTLMGGLGQLASVSVLVPFSASAARSVEAPPSPQLPPGAMTTMGKLLLVPRSALINCVAVGSAQKMLLPFPDWGVHE